MKIKLPGLSRISLILLQCEVSVSAEDVVALLSLQVAALLYVLGHRRSPEQST